MCKSIFIRCLLAFVYFGVLTISSTEVIAQALPNPSSVTATGGDGYIDLSWSWNTSDTPTGWTLSFNYEVLFNDISGGIKVAGNANARKFRITTIFNNSLTNGAIFEVRLRASAENADQTQSRTSGNVSVTATPNIDAPNSLSVTSGDGEVTLSWTAVPNVDTITGYEYSKDDGATWTLIPNSDKTTATYTVTGLTNGTEYTFKVRAVGKGGGGKAAGIILQLPLAAPTNLSAIPGNGEVTLRWTAPSGPIDSYNYRQNGGSWRTTGWTPATGTSTNRTVTGLTNGTEYTFEVRAVSGGRGGRASTSVTAIPSATPPPPPPPLTDTTPPVDINAGTTETLTVQRVNSRTVTLSWDIPTALNAQTIAYEYSTNGGQTWTPTNSRNTSIIITGDGFGDLPPTQFKIRAMNETNGTRSFVIISATAIQRQRRVILECPLGWTRGSVFGNTKKALIYELKVDADTTNRTSIYQLKSIAIYVHPDETLETLDGWTLKIGTLYNQFGKEFKLTAENSVIDEYDFAHIENPEGTPIPMGMLGYIGQSLPSFDYRLYDATGVRVDFGISCYKGGGLTWRLWNTKDPRLLRVLPLGTSEESLSVQMQNLNWNTPFFRSEWTAAVMPDLPAAPAAPSQMKGNIVGTWGDLKKQ